VPACGRLCWARPAAARRMLRPASQQAHAGRSHQASRAKRQLEASLGWTGGGSDLATRPVACLRDRRYAQTLDTRPPAPVRGMICRTTACTIEASGCSEWIVCALSRSPFMALSPNNLVLHTKHMHPRRQPPPRGSEEVSLGLDLFVKGLRLPRHDARSQTESQLQALPSYTTRLDGAREALHSSAGPRCLW
jgi:hypothetical protein